MKIDVLIHLMASIMSEIAHPSLQCAPYRLLNEMDGVKSANVSASTNHEHFGCADF